MLTIPLERLAYIIEKAREFDAESADLDLAVQAPDELEVPSRPVAGQVARAGQA